MQFLILSNEAISIHAKTAKIEICVKKTSRKKGESKNLREK